MISKTRKFNESSQRQSTIELRIQGMNCVEETTVLEKQLAPLPGVKNISFDLFSGKSICYLRSRPSWS